MKESASDETQADPLKTIDTGGIPSLLAELDAYLKSCRCLDETDGKKKADGFPNLAGFCRYLGCGITTLEGVRLSDPTLYDHICAILEDEALNAEISPTVLTAYLKKRLGYSEKSDDRSNVDCGEVRFIFEHDILEDGS